MTVEIEMDTGMNYGIQEKVGALNYRPRSTMTFEQYQQYQDEEIKKEYWKDRSAGLDGESAVSGRRLIPKLYISPIFDRLFGGNYVDIQPTGFVNMDFGGRWQTIENPAVPVRNQTTGGFNYNQQISMNVVGKIGEKLSVNANFDNNNSFDFQNNMKIEYTGYEEDIIKKLEVGNVSMPIANSLITGGQSLFGVKAQMQFGKLYVTALASRQQGSAQTKSFQDGYEVNGDGDGDGGFSIRSSDYDENRHFFLGHFFRENYEYWLRNKTRVVSGVKISRIEVYVVKQQTETTGLRGIVALADLGEPERINGSNITSSSASPNDNDANSLFDDIENVAAVRSISSSSDYLSSNYGMTEGKDFEARSIVRKLESTEYKLHDKQGYITLNSRLSSGEALAVSYEYTYGGTTYQVGELSENYQIRGDDELIIMKLLMPTKNTDSDNPVWDLMMRNVYSLGGSRISEEGFELKVYYRDDVNNYNAPNLNEGQNTSNIPLIEVLNLDQLNQNGDNQPDGNFDFISDITFDEDYGNVIFPVLEPFGSHLESVFADTEQSLKDKYVYSELYDRTQSLAENVSTKNKFLLKGTYVSSGSTSGQQTYNLNAYNISDGSISVTAGGTLLQENVDYTVSYIGGGTVTITNQGIVNSGKVINISYETDDLFSFQSKWLTGTRMDYQFNDKINIGATLLHYSERTGGISRYSIGNEPLNNTKYGFDVNYQQDSRLLTKIVDALPLISTKETSTVSFSGEFAQLIPGTSNKVDGESTSYIDDFENAATPFSLEGGHQGWKLGSAPEDFKEVSSDGTNLGTGYRRAKLAWYNIDRSEFYLSSLPNGIDETDMANNYVKAVYAQDIFRQQDLNVRNVPLYTFDLAYYPSERGPYNYNTRDLNQDGFLDDPKSNFASISRAVPSSQNFKENNISYIEFWLMDPFTDHVIDDGNGNPQPNRDANGDGRIILHFGDVSEDVLEDNVLASENALPADGSNTGTTITEWGRIASDPPLQYAFDTESSSRNNQDVGWDGYGSGGGEDYFLQYMDLSGLVQSARQNIEADVSADDYMHFLNSAYDERGAKVLERYKNFNGLEGNSPIQSRSATNIPDHEDIEGDRNLITDESYFEYDIPINKDVLVPGRGYVIDQVEDRSGDANWFLFRIPISDGLAVGDVDLQSIRHVRLTLTGWSTPVVLRMEDFQLVQSQWWKYEQDLAEAGLGEIPEVSTSDFDVSVVGVEENSSPSGGRPPYIVPPGINRDLDTSSGITRQINEQSLRVCVDDLEDGDARAVYKTNLSYDMVNYGRIKMFFHAEANEGEMISDDEVTGFIRLGFDQTQNYYEIEVPLKITPDGLGNSNYTARDIWPEENEIDLAFNELYTVKSARNADDFDVTQRYTRESLNGEYKITIIGNPKLSGVTDMMIGVRNPTSDDGRDKSVCIWANEMRVTDFDDEKGWAANARLNMKLADFATINASTSYTSVGFGGIQQGISERSREETFDYDLSANVNLDKLIPAETGIRLPMYVSTSKSTSTPRYDPLDSDIPLEASLDKFETEEEKEDYRKKVITQSTSKSINFSNVGKDKVKKDAKKHVYDIENFTLDYSYNEQKYSNVSTAQRINKNYSGGLAYNYATSVPSVEPFKDVKAFSSPYLKLIKDINFNPLPNSFSFRAGMDRSFQRTQLRNADLTTDGIDPNYEKYFTFDRSYTLRWSLFKNLSLNYNATARAIIDEPEGDIDTQAKRDSIWSNIKRLGRIKNYNQSLSMNYRLPLDKLPLTDWMSADYRYSVDYSWVGGNIDQVEEFGNTLENSRTQDLTGKIDMLKLYNKSKYLNSINKPARQSRTSRYDTVRTSGGVDAFKGILRLMMALRSINLSYGLREATVLPGILTSPYMLGMDRDFNAPGWDFVLGSQNPEIRHRAARNNWLVRNGEFTDSFEQSRTEDLNLRASIEPFKDFRIQLDASRSSISDYSEIFRLDSITGQFTSVSPVRSGSYTVSFLPILTAFDKDNSENVSATFRQFEENREVILARQNTLNSSGEYNLNSQDVLIPAFIAAYTGQDATSVRLLPFPKIPVPNWRLDYAGLSKLGGLKEVFSSINLTHSYTSSFSISNYTNSLKYSDANTLELTNDILDYPMASISDDNGSLIPVYEISQVDVIERFSPLIGVNIRTKNNVTGKVDYSRERSLSFDLYNKQIRELKSNNISFDFGLAKDNWKFPFKVKGRTVVVENQIQVRMAFTIRDTKTVQRKIDDVHTITDGNINYQIRPQISYLASQRLNLTMYFEKNINEPRISTSYNRSSSQFGLQVRFSLSE